MTIRGSLVVRLAWLLPLGAVVACGATPREAPTQAASRQGRPPRDPAEPLERLEDSVTQVESATGPLDGRQLAGVVQALASSLEPLSNPARPELKALASRIAGAPERATETSPGRAGWIRAGLQAAVDALLLVSGGERSPWIDEAQRAVVGIDERSASSFQRAAIQDALRATVDAFAALEPSYSERPSQP